MKGKKIAVLSLALSSLLAFTVAGVACNKGGGGTNAGSETAVSLISDSTLTDKFFALYTFEDTGDVLTAIDPYTGAIADTFNGSYFNTAGRVTNPKKQTDASGSQYVLDTDSAVRLGNFSSVIGDEFDDNNMPTGSVQDGLSFSFWAYNNETIVGPVEGSDESADWSNMITNGLESINWGNLTHLEATTNDGSYTNVYPSRGNNFTVGRGAYTDGADGSYEAARAIYSTEQLSSYWDSYAVWNAVSGNRQDGSAQIPDNEYIEDVAAAHLNNWRYLTVNIDYAEGLSFYVNGRFAYRYAPDAFEENSAMGSNGYGGWKAIYADFVLGAIKSGSAYIDMFGAECGITVDDLIVGKSITETDACALYEDITGNTWTEDDLKLESAASAIDQEKAAFDAATLDALLEGVQTPVEGDTLAAGITREDTDDDGHIDDTVYDARAEWLENYNADDYTVIGTFENNGGNVTFGHMDSTIPNLSQYYVPTVNSDGTFEMTISGIQMASGIEQFHTIASSIYMGDTQLVWMPFVMASYGANGVTVANTNPNIVWDDGSNMIHIDVIQRFCKMDVIFKYDGTNLTLTFNMYYYFAGETYSTTLSDGTPYSYTVPKSGTTLYNSMMYTISPAAGTVLDYDALSIKLGVQGAAYLIPDTGAVVGGAASDTPPEVNVDEDEAAKAEAEAAALAKIEADRKAAWQNAYSDASIVENIGSAALDNGYVQIDELTGIEYTPTGVSGTSWSMTLSGYFNSSAAGYSFAPAIAVYSDGGANSIGVIRPDLYVNINNHELVQGNPEFTAQTNVAFTTSITDGTTTSDAMDWAVWTNVIKYAKVSITISYDGSDISIVWVVEAADKDKKTYTENYTYGQDGTGSVSVTVPDETITITATITNASAADVFAKHDSMSFRIGTEQCYFVITEATGCDYTPVSAD